MQLHCKIATRVSKVARQIIAALDRFTSVPKVTDTALMSEGKTLYHDMHWLCHCYSSGNVNIYYFTTVAKGTRSILNAI